MPSQCNGTVHANGSHGDGFLRPAHDSLALRKGVIQEPERGDPPQAMPRVPGTVCEACLACSIPACGRRRNRPYHGVIDCSLPAVATPRYLLLHLLHAQIQFRDVVRGGNKRVSREQQDGIAMIPQSQQKVVALAPLPPSPSARR